MMVDGTKTSCYKLHLDEKLHMYFLLYHLFALDIFGTTDIRLMVALHFATQFYLLA